MLFAQHAFLKLTRLAEQKQKTLRARFLFLFGTRLAQQKKHSGAAGARFFLFGTRLTVRVFIYYLLFPYAFCSERLFVTHAAGRANKKLRARVFLFGTRPVTHSLAGRGSCGHSFRGAFFLLFGTRLAEQKNNTPGAFFVFARDAAGRAKRRKRKRAGHGRGFFWFGDAAGRAERSKRKRAGRAKQNTGSIDRVPFSRVTGL